MLPYVASTQISIGSLVIQTWGLFAALGSAFGVLAAVRYARHRRLDRDTMLDLGLASVIAGFVGARLGFVLNEWSSFAGRPWSALAIWEGGLASWGGVAGIVLALLIVVRRRRLAVWPYADALALGGTIGLAFGRIGCSFIHDHLGRITTMPWGVLTPDGTIRHEPSYYLLLFDLALFAILWRLSRGRYPAGLVSAVFLIAIGTGRIFFDSFRATDLPTADPHIGALTVAQVVFLVQIAIGLWVYWRRSREQTLAVVGGARYSSGVGGNGDSHLRGK